MTRLSKYRQRFQINVELPYIELLGSQSPVYNERLAECCGEVLDVPNVFGSSSDASDWEWLQEYGDISVLENCPGLYEKCININEICCRNDRHIVAGPTLAELNEGRALSPLINPDMKRLHLVATERTDDKFEQLTDNSCLRINRPCLTEINRPIARKYSTEDCISISKKFENSRASLRKMLLYGLNHPGALNSVMNKNENDQEIVILPRPKEETCTETSCVERPRSAVKEEEFSATEEDMPSDSESERSSEKEFGVNDEEFLSSASEDNDDGEETPVKSHKVRKRSEADDWTPDAKKLLEISKQLERLNKIINSLRPIGHLSVNARNKTRREKNRLASRACRLKKKAGHEANKIKLFGLNQENKHLSEIIYDVKSLLAVRGAERKRSLSLEDIQERAQKVLEEQISGRTQEYVDSMLKSSDSSRVGRRTKRNTTNYFIPRWVEICEHPDPRYHADPSLKSLQVALSTLEVVFLPKTISIQTMPKDIDFSVVWKGQHFR